MQYFFFINRTLDAKLLIYSDRVADGKEHKECNYYPPAFLPPNAGDHFGIPLTMRRASSANSG